MPQYLFAQEGIRAISMLLGGEQCAGRRTRAITSYLWGTAAGLRCYNGQIAAVGTVMRDDVDGDAWRLDDVHAVDVLHHAKDVVHLTDFKDFFWQIWTLGFPVRTISPSTECHMNGTFKVTY